MCDSIDGKCPGQADPQTQSGFVAVGAGEFLFGKMKKLWRVLRGVAATRCVHIKRCTLLNG